MKRGLEKFNRLVEAFETLPTVGKKSALRFAYHLVINDNLNAMRLANSIESAIINIKQCHQCGGISENEICEICLDKSRNNKNLCIVESPKDILIMEENKVFDGVYFVLFNLEDEIITKLKILISDNEIREIIFALTPGLSSDAIMLYIEDKLKDFDIKFTKIAQGVPTGVNIENIDTLSLIKAMESRVKA